ncbi:MAG: DUF3618 domain-containing protein [Halioglobus sp.]
MVNGTRSAEEIERDSERERAQLTHTLEELKRQFSMDAIIRKSAEQIREHGADIGVSVARTAKENPLALALTGVGLAWLIAGDSKRRSYERYDRYGIEHSDAAPRNRPPAGGARDAIAETYEGARTRASAAGSRISKGTEHLSEEARKRVVAARERALAARDKAQRSLRDAGQSSADYYQEQPLVVGAIAVAVGAALGGAVLDEPGWRQAAIALRS